MAHANEIESHSQELWCSHCIRIALASKLAKHEFNAVLAVLYFQSWERALISEMDILIFN